MSTPEVEQLCRRAEDALAAGLSQRQVRPLAQRLFKIAAPSSEAWIFAARTLAEFAMETNPWRTLTLLRTIRLAGRDDESTWALQGLAHAVLQNYDSAIVAYQRAVDLAPNCPFYLHNLGHLLDVAAESPQAARPALQKACELTGFHEAEIIQSLAQCVFRLGEGELALRLIAQARELRPTHQSYRDSERLFRTELRRAAHLRDADKATSQKTKNDSSERTPRVHKRPPTES